nr:unnamed protein product [Digitaria exilis]
MLPRARPTRTREPGCPARPAPFCSVSLSSPPPRRSSTSFSARHPKSDAYAMGHVSTAAVGLPLRVERDSVRHTAARCSF